MKVINNKTQSGFSLIELVIVLVVLGILAAIAVPRYVDLQAEAESAAAAGNAAAAKSAFAIHIAETKAFPNANDLIGRLNPAPTFSGGNLAFTIGSNTYNVPLYVSNTCTGALVGAATDAIGCVGAIVVS